jgi:hypothetical protein
MNRKWYSRPILYGEKSMAVFVALALLLSLTILIVPMAGTTEAGIIPTVVWVDDDFTAGSCGGHVWNYDAFNTTQEGINGVANNGMVYIAEGEYTGFYIIERSGIDVVGTEGVIINYPPMYEEETTPFLAGIADSIDITIENIEFQCPSFESMEPSGFGDSLLPFPFIYENVAAGISCFNSTGTISSVTVRDMISPVPDEVTAVGIFVVGGLIDETVTISDSTIENCMIGVMVLLDHIILDSCSISGVTMDNYGSWGVFSELAMVDILNCDITGCQGGWEELHSPLEGFGQPEIVVGSSGIITLLARLRINGCTISNNDFGVLILPPEFVGTEMVDSFSSYATDRLKLEQGSFADSEPPFITFLTTTAILNNITGNTYYGIGNAFNEPVVDATNNWWGSVDGPELYEPEPGDTGYNMTLQFEDNPVQRDTIAGNITYQPWLGSPLSLPAVHQQSLAAGVDQLVDASEEADTTITITTTGATNITIASYESQPFPDKEFPDASLGKYIDIYISNPEAVTWPVHVELSYTHDELLAAGVDESSLGLYYYTPDESIKRCSNTGVNSIYNFIWANLTETEAGCLAGSPFASGGDPYVIGGEAYPVNKTGLVITLITIGAATVICTMSIIRRRKITS